MAILFENNSDDIVIVVYKIEESIDYYLKGIDFTHFDKSEFQQISHQEKRLQWLASRYWVKKLSKQHYQLNLEKSDLGKPLITNFPMKFSISHSGDLIAVICSKEREVAIDIEVDREKVLKVKNKFLHPSDFEQGNDIDSLTLIWSAKETIYKYYHTKSLYSFKEEIAITTCNEKQLDYWLKNEALMVSSSMFYKKDEVYVLTWLV